MSILLTVYIALNCLVAGVILDRIIVQKKIKKEIEEVGKVEKIADELESRYESDEIRAEYGTKEQKEAESLCTFWGTERYAFNMTGKVLRTLHKETDLLNFE